MRRAYSTLGDVKYAVLASQINQNQCNESLPAAATEFDPFECSASTEPLPATLWPPALTVWLVLPMRLADGLGWADVAGLDVVGLDDPTAGEGLDGVAAAAVAGADLAMLVIAEALVDASLVAVASAPALTALVDRTSDLAALSAL